MFIEWIEEDDRGDEIVHHLPARYEICDRCSGSGGSSAYLGAFTSYEFNEQFDADEQESYFAGAFDRACEHCDRTGKVKLVDEKRVDPKVLERWLKERREIEQMEAEEASERRYFAMCAGEY